MKRIQSAVSLGNREDKRKDETQRPCERGLRSPPAGEKIHSVSLHQLCRATVHAVVRPCAKQKHAKRKSKCFVYTDFTSELIRDLLFAYTDVHSILSAKRLYKLHHYHHYCIIINHAPNFSEKTKTKYVASTLSNIYLQQEL